MTVQWSGAYVRDVLGVNLTSAVRSSLFRVESLIGLALRHNPKRAHLLVSRVLAKHVPTEPGIATAAGRLLGLLVREEIGVPDTGRPADADAAFATEGHGCGPNDRSASLRALIEDAAEKLNRLLATEWSAGLASELQGEERRRDRLSAITNLREVLGGPLDVLPGVVTIGYAETATGLGQLVADRLGTYYLHSTRESATTTGVAPYGAFEELHSHATSHRLLPSRRADLDLANTVVLVDDELSTGATIINTIRELHLASPRARFIIASLVDLRSAEDRARIDALAGELGIRISAVALAQGGIHLPETLPGDAAEHIDGFTRKDDKRLAPGQIQLMDLTETVTPIRSGRFGIAGRSEPQQAADIAAILGASPSLQIKSGDRLLVLATEEFMALPLAVADQLQQHLPDNDVRFSSSTRSPIAVLDEPGYAVRSAVEFRNATGHGEGSDRRFAYNFAHAGARFETVVIMAEPGTPALHLTGPGMIAEAVAGTGAAVLVVLLPQQEPFPSPLTGPSFGSYAPDDVQWLLKDLSSAKLEAPAREREAAIQSGKASYAESLPQEFEPSPQYTALFEAALDRSAGRLAQAVGTLTEQVLKLRDDAPVLVSLARAGTPVGVLMKRWAKEVHGLDLPHYAISIIRGLGIDQTGLGYLASKHKPEQIMFVDGWTGKGAIARELAAAVELFRKTDKAAFRPDLAVLADPGHSVRIFGTREDYLVPSACLNSTVSGLVSRTVFNKQLIGPDDFHGAKFYSQLSQSDKSNTFLDAVTDKFGTVRHDVLATAASLPTRIEQLPEADWRGWAAVESISRDYGINNVNLVKPGVGETTRVLLRRVPWKILVHPDAYSDIAHVLHLAQQRGVEVLEVANLAYSCVGLIHPVHTPGAVGADGRSVIDV
ncbi:phosphoribosyltransferase domain-containing protein [Arthrobacter bambusae]|uniref:Pyrimidine operon attenuation protein/uracil phosphoribosyltransferase n=1 Tax=Arthrobacter bambusae TaxID=1338426 RepID=A0AAW8DBA1_9MICC|nr:phosphoribosyltransferase domain-containing protein [Arthrobacter bambusae]MDP9905632.1 pyrimidine operon attenuation protein/uracil phosphoribosyltransferase [Arthrobacter bambusae]MDQ0127286.1 pyrimidine operon attenuation protein/uracil phosphoribosyltransferase [Arthrobacter bambusae]MDQ0178628.1 pyrimidine operon attenuation protein/uracil phosphoribosyltransferase [Arthrobacter bambusae]